MRTTIVALLSSVALVAASTVEAAPVFNPATGNHYDFVPFGAAALNWDQARAAATSSTFLGASGYLTTITSSDENDFIVAQFGSAASSGFFAWAGGTDAAVEGTWRWADGPEAGRQFSSVGTATPPDNYVNWGGIEPNNAGPDNYLMINLGATFGPILQGEWADAALTPSTADPVQGYLVEFTPRASSVPLPPSLIILGVGVVAMSAAARRLRRQP